ncbi:PAS domain S-box protein [Calothrix sp. 336/3]|uniref:PAS domain S-box protein n=1 Tax=Calothrix sp. 336/3 TaxID=1337936 RepID=UPI00069C3BFC|nr:PAS domain S-box protein [Calothrix sp. 336/3]
MDSTQVNILGYRIHETLYDGSKTLVCRAFREADNLPVVIKLLKNSYPDFSELVKFRNQYTIAKNLNHPGIIQTYSLESLQNCFMLVMEDFGGISLKSYFSHRETRFIPSLEEFLQIAISLCDTLDVLYHQRIIHKDIKPTNILINPDTRQVKIIDFSIASLLPRETQTLISSNILEGTLSYISPEQTGRMNRGIDYRTDFYSLGVTFYELLTGELPFHSEDAMELIYFHIAKTAPLVNEINQQIPTVISEIIRKLMAKNPEDRYQSALGLKYDLEKCLMQFQETGRVEDFPIAQRNICDRFIIPDKLYGRETEVQTLLEAFVRVASPNGATEIMLISGFSGIGKTAVVNEVHKPIVQQRGYFIKGKFDQFNRNIPFSAFVQAFRNLMGQLLTESDTQIQLWKHKILEAVAENGQIIIEVIPELEKIIGKQPLATELSGAAAENRFNLLFQSFTQVFASDKHPLVIFLDDLQWADSASLKLIQLLISNTHHILLIGAYRDNEVNAGHLLMLTLNDIHKAKITINRIILAPLSPTTVNILVSETLQCSNNTVWKLSQIIHKKTEGNPFFIVQYLKALHQDKIINFNFDLGCWECDITLLKYQNITDDIVGFISSQVQKLVPLTQNILQLAACIGNQFDLETLAIISQQSQSDTAAILWEALQEELILPVDEIYKFFVGQETSVGTWGNTHTVTYKFLHDRVQEAAYSLIPDHQKQATHLQIGRLLLKNTSPERQEEKLFTIVNHLNMGSTLITQAQEREHLAKLNLTAGKKAKISHAYSAAIAYLEQGIQLLPNDCWDRLYSLTLALHKEITNVSYLNSDFAAVEKWSSVVCQEAKTLIDTIKVQQNRIIAANVQGKLFDALQIGLSFLRSLGLEFPEQPTQEDIAQAFGRTRSLWADKPISSLLDLPPLNDTHLLAQMEILTVLSSTAYVAAPSLMPLLIFKQVEICIQFGNCPISVFTYSDFGVILCGVIGDIESGYEFGELAINLRERWQLSSFKSRTLFVINYFVKHWKTSLSQIVPSIEEAYQSGIETGDVESGILNAGIYCFCAYYQGQVLTELLPKMDAYRQIIINHKHLHCLFLQSITHQTMINLLGRNQEPDRLTGDIFDADTLLPQIQANNYRSVIAHWQLSQLILYYLFNKNDEAARISAQALEYLDGATATFGIVLYSWFDALNQLQLYPNLDPAERQEILQQIQQQQDKLQHWANFAPTNHQHRWELVTAEKNRVEDNKIAAIEYYDRAITSAKTNGFIQDVALANELAAKFYLAWGKEKFAAIYMQEAYNCYKQWGAKAKTQDLAQNYPQLLISVLAPVQGAVVSTAHISESAREFSATLDLNTVLTANQALSREIHLDQLLQNLIQLVITNAGASKAALFLNCDGSLELGVLYFDHAVQSLERKPLDSCQYLSHRLIRYVERTLETVITDFKTHVSTTNDPYCLQFRPKSLLCTPILNQGQLVAVLYLENSITAEVFTNERVELLKLLCSQAAISLANARLYEQSQSYAQQLERSLQKLSESQSQFQALAKNIPGVIFKVSVNLKDGSESIPYASSGCYELYGVTAESFMAGEYFFRDFEHPEDYPRIEQAIQKSIKHLTPLREELRIITKTGEMKWIQIVAQPQILPGGFIVSDGVLLDISERKQAEAALGESEAKFRGLVEGVTDVIWSSNTDGTLTYLSPQFQTLFGWNPADWIGKSFSTLIHPDDLQETMESSMATIIQGKKLSNQEFRHLCHDGSYLWVTVNAGPIFDADGNITRHQGIVRDISDRKQAEIELEKSRQKYYSLIQSVNGIVWEYDLQTNRFTFVSNKAEQILGYPVEDWLNEPLFWKNHVYAEDIEVEKSFDEAIQNQSGCEFEYRMVAADGSLVWIYDISSPNFDENGNLTSSSGVLIDISDRKKLEEEQSRLMDILEATPDYIGLASVSGKIIWHNKQLRELRQDLISHKNISECHPAWVNEIILNQVFPILMEQGSWSGELALLDSNGQEIPVSQVIIAHKSQSGEVQYISTIMRDISEQKAAEKQLILTKFAIESTVTSIFWISEQAGFIDVNDAACTALGYSAAELKQMFVWDIDPNVSKEAWAERLEILKLSRYERFETLHRSKDGSIYPVEITSNYLEYGGVGYIFAQGQNISDRKAYEERLEKNNAELIRATRMKDEFLATMSHELRTPMNAILGMTEALQDEIFGEINAQQLKALATVERSGNHLLELINDILDVSKIASGQIELEYQSTEIIPLCQQSLEFIKPQAAKKSIQIVSQLPTNLPNLNIDERRIRQVLINLLNNAVKFTPEGGCITLEVIYPTTIKQQNYLQINVKDTGIGIAPENLNKIFEPFIQVDSALNRNYEGTGLGLALVKRIVEMHHGEVTLTSELGVGSCFAIALPL